MTAQEMKQHGLTGVIYDAPYCPTKFDPAGKGLVVDGPCEAVTCEPNFNGTLRCVAKKAK